MTDVLFALVLLLNVDGTSGRYPINYSLSMEECAQKAQRINFIVQQHPKATNIIEAQCDQINLQIIKADHA